MKALKKLLAVLLGTAVMCGCSANTDNSDKSSSASASIDTSTSYEKTDDEDKSIEKISIVFSPYEDAEGITKASQSFSNALKTSLEEKGYKIGSVESVVAANYEEAGKMLSDGKADIGFISGSTYVYFENGCSVLLTGLKNTLDNDSRKAEDWNGEEGETVTDDITKKYRGLIIAGPSEKGNALSEKFKNGEKISWDDINSATWAIMPYPSDAGYVYTSLWLYENYGKTIDQLENVKYVNTYYDGLKLAANGEADIIASYSYIRANYADKWAEINTLGANGDIYKDTTVIGVTSKIYNDTVCISKKSEIMSDEFKDDLADVFIELGESEEEENVISAFGHVGYTKAVSEDYDGARTARDLLKSVE